MEDVSPQPVPPKFPGESPRMDPRDERQWVTFLHLSGFAGYLIPFGSIIAPLVMWLLKRDQSALVDDQGKESLNFHLSMLLFYLISIPLMFVFVGFFTAIAVLIVEIVFMVIAAVKSNEGEVYRYPVTIRFVS